jgi:hypothetical protein
MNYSHFLFEDDLDYRGHGTCWSRQRGRASNPASISGHRRRNPRHPRLGIPLSAAQTAGATN